MRKRSVLILLVLVILAIMLVAAPVSADPATVKVPTLQPSWFWGVYSAYYGPPDYLPMSPGDTRVYLGREAGVIKAGLVADPDDNYWDQGLFGFRPVVDIDGLATRPLTYDVVNECGTRPVWMTIELDTGELGTRTDNVVFQFVPPSYADAEDYYTVEAGAGKWLQWNNNYGDTTGSSPMTLKDIASDYPGLPVVTACLRLGMGSSYHDKENGTVAWVDRAVIGGVTYDFVVRGKGVSKHDWSQSPAKRASFLHVHAAP